MGSVLAARGAPDAKRSGLSARGAVAGVSSVLPARRTARSTARSMESVLSVLAPEGPRAVPARRDGWSVARAQPRDVEPVESGMSLPPRPSGAEESDHGDDLRGFYSARSAAPPGRKRYRE